MVNGVIDSDGNVIYIFIDYVDIKENVIVNIIMLVYIDFENVIKIGNVILIIGIGSIIVNKIVLVDYEKYGKFYNLFIKGIID